MSDPSENAAVAAERKRFAERTVKSRQAFEAVESLIPGAAPGGMVAWPPGTSVTFMERGEGCWIYDVDGSRYLDLILGDWTLLLGHSDPVVSAAIADQLSRGTTLCSPESEHGVAVATEINRRMPSMERMRFTTSGTEAVMHAMRVARAATGRPKIAKMRGAYHGTHDVSLIANAKYPDPNYVPPGLIPGTVESTVLLEFNDSQRSLEVIRAHKDDLAAVIIEPIHATNGMVPASIEYLRALREETERHGIVLIFDEVVTWPVGDHGAQGLFGVTPDLTTMGKAIGGGLPLGVFGGSAELMKQVDAKFFPGALGQLQSVSPVRHGSTLGGIAITMAAAHATLSRLTPEVHAQLDGLADHLRHRIAALGAELGMPLQATGAGHLFGLHWTEEPVVDIASAMTSNRQMLHIWNLFLFNRGFYIFPNANGVVATPMAEADLDLFLEALKAILVEGDEEGWLVV